MVTAGPDMESNTYHPHQQLHSPSSQRSAPSIQSINLRAEEILGSFNNLNDCDNQAQTCIHETYQHQERYFP
jgi:hypothetical protein